MRSTKRRDWYDEIYDTYVLMHLRGDEANIVEWTPFGRNSIDITFRDGSVFRYNYFRNSTRTLRSRLSGMFPCLPERPAR